MEELLDDLGHRPKATTNYKKWAFRLFIYLISCNLAIGYLMASFMPMFHDEAVFVRNLTILSFMAFAFLCAGSICTVLSYNNKEEKNYQYKVSIWGYPIFIVLGVLTLLFS